MAWTDWYTEEELARARANADEFGMGTDMSPNSNLFNEVQSSESTTGSGAQILQPTFESLGKYIEENPAEAAIMGLTFIPGVGWVARGAMSGYKAIRGSSAIDKLLRGGKSAAESLTTKPVPLLSKGTGKTPKGQPLVNTKGETLMTRGFSPARTAGTAGAVTLGVNEISKEAGKTSLLGQVQPTAPTTPSGPATPYSEATSYGGADEYVMSPQDAKTPSIWDTLKTAFKPEWKNLGNAAYGFSYYGASPEERRYMKSPDEMALARSQAMMKGLIDAADLQIKTNKAQGGGSDIFSKIGATTQVNAIKDTVAKALGKDQIAYPEPSEGEIEEASNRAVIEINNLLAKTNPKTGKKYTYDEAQKEVLKLIKPKSWF